MKLIIACVLAVSSELHKKSRGPNVCLQVNIYLPSLLLKNDVGVEREARLKTADSLTSSSIYFYLNANAMISVSLSQVQSYG